MRDWHRLQPAGLHLLQSSQAWKCRWSTGCRAFKYRRYLEPLRRWIDSSRLEQASALLAPKRLQARQPNRFRAQMPCTQGHGIPRIQHFRCIKKRIGGVRGQRLPTPQRHGRPGPPTQAAWDSPFLTDDCRCEHWLKPTHDPPLRTSRCSPRRELVGSLSQQSPPGMRLVGHASCGAKRCCAVRVSQRHVVTDIGGLQATGTPISKPTNWRWFQTGEKNPAG